jgi:hypothetical protein
MVTARLLNIRAVTKPPNVLQKFHSFVPAFSISSAVIYLSSVTARWPYPSHFQFDKYAKQKDFGLICLAQHQPLNVATSHRLSFPHHFISHVYIDEVIVKSGSRLALSQTFP